MRRLPLIAVAALALTLPCTAAEQTKFAERWNYLKANLSNEAGLQTFLDLLKLSKENGCTHILMPESRWLKMADNPDYLKRVEKAQAAAKELNLTIVPVVFALGYSGRYLGFDPNLCAGLPVRNLPFVVKGRTAAPDPAEALDVSKLVNGGGTLKARPFTHYRISFYVKGTIEGGEDTLRATAGGSGRWLTRSHPTVKKEGERSLVTTTFNSLEGDTVRISINVKGFEELKIEPAGTLMIIRRELTPLKVTSEDGKTVYKEGEDFKPVADPVISAKPFGGEFPMDHKAADIELTENSSIKDGQKLLVSFWHAYRMGEDQDLISMEDPKVFEIMDKDVSLCTQVWKPAGYFMNYDEIRIGGWENQPDGKNLKPGELLAAHVKKAVEIVKKHAPDARIYTWSDMFTPFHNARPFKAKGFYYLVNGNWDESWEGLPKDVIIMNWYSPDQNNMKFFAERGHHQVLCGYYDGTSTAKMKTNIGNWMKVSEGVPNVLGFMYTTWRNDYKNLKEYFALVDTYNEWGQGGGKTGAEPEPGVKN